MTPYKGQLHEEASLAAELGAPIGRGGAFLEPGGGEVAAGERRAIWRSGRGGGRDM
jgi:hypothetical protein